MSMNYSAGWKRTAANWLTAASWYRPKTCWRGACLK
jgi:hypothetical protein